MPKAKGPLCTRPKNWAGSGGEAPMMAGRAPLGRVREIPHMVITSTFIHSPRQLLSFAVRGASEEGRKGLRITWAEGARDRHPPGSSRKRSSTNLGTEVDHQPLRRKKNQEEEEEEEEEE